MKDVNTTNAPLVYKWAERSNDRFYFRKLRHETP
jgi:hypothetical protein